MGRTQFICTLRTWDLGFRTWELGAWSLELGKRVFNDTVILTFCPVFLYLKRVNFRLSCHPDGSQSSKAKDRVIALPSLEINILLVLQMVVKFFLNRATHSFPYF